MNTHYYIIRRLLTVALLLSGMASALHAQQQDALYIYRNDGSFNAFFFTDIQRIAYSNIDTLGVEHDDYVTQEVYALDSVFRIPVSAIDSVVFVTPPTEYKADVAHTTESDLWKYVIATDSVSWIKLRPDVPQQLIPNVGDKMVTLTQSDMLPMGFAGKVADVTTASDGVTVTCENVELTDLFDRYVCKVAGYVGSEDDSSGAPQKAPRRAGSEQPFSFDKKMPPMAKTLHLTGSFGLDDNFSIDGNAYVGVQVQPELNLRLFLSVGWNTGVNMDCVMRGQMETQLQFGFNGIATGHFDFPLVKLAFPVIGCPLVLLNFEAGAFVEMQGSLNVGGVYSTTERFYALTQFNSLIEGGRQATASITHVKDTLTWNDVTAKATLNIGGYLKKSITGASAKITESGIRSEMGLRAEVEAPVQWSDFTLTNPNLLAGEALRLAIIDNQKRSRSLYDKVDRDVNVALSVFSNVQTFAKIMRWTFTKKWEETKIYGTALGLVPHISKPTVRMATLLDDKLHIDMPAERELLFPLKIGADIYNSRNELVRQIDAPTSYLGKKPQTQTLTVGGLPETEKYMAYPRMEMFGFRLYAQPTDSFSAAKATLEVPVRQFTVPSSYGHFTAKVNTTIPAMKFTPTASWLSCLWDADEQTLTVYYDGMTGQDTERKASIQIMALDGDGSELGADEIVVTQVRADIELSTTELAIGVKGGSATIVITANNTGDLQVSTKSSFLHPTINGNTLSILIDENTSEEEREGTVIVSGRMAQTDQRIERFISVSQAGTATPVAVDMFNMSRVYINVPTGTVNIPMTIPYYGSDYAKGSTAQQGQYLRYKSADTKAKSFENADYSGSVSWQIDLLIDPKDNTSLHKYDVVSGSVSYKEDTYYKGKLSYERLCSFDIVGSLKNSSANQYSNMTSFTASHGTDSKPLPLTDYMQNFFHSQTSNGTTDTYNQTDINTENTGWSLYIDLQLEDDIPMLEVGRDSIKASSGNFGSTFSYFYYNKNITAIEISASEDWITIEDITPSMATNNEAGMENFTVKYPVNDSKADRTGFIYVKGTLADGSSITRTIVVTQPYERIWDDDQTETTDQSAELPSAALQKLLTDNGMPIYTGTTPPTVNGTFEMKPLSLVYASNPDDIDDDYSGSMVMDIATLTGQKPQARLRMYSNSTQYGTTPADTYLCSLTGDGNHFTLSCITVDTNDSPLGFWKMTTITIISGEVEATGIVNLHYGSIFLDENDQPDEVIIMKDSDGQSTTAAWQPGSWQAPWKAARKARRKAN